MSRFRWYRRLRGGTWAYVTDKTIIPTGRCRWQRMNGKSYVGVRVLDMEVYE